MANGNAAPRRGNRGVARFTTLKLVQSYLAALGSPLARQVGGDIRALRFASVMEAPFPDPKSYTDADSFRKDYAAYHVLRKYPHFGTVTSRDRVRVALEKFKASEESCREVNGTFPYDVIPPGFKEGTLGMVLHQAQRKIYRLLGDFQEASIVTFCSFSGGASYALKRTQGDPYYKLGSVLSSTPKCLDRWKDLVLSSPSWVSSLTSKVGDDSASWFKLVPGNRLTTVPKDAKVDRVIAIEPELNMFVQKGIGTVIRRKLLKVGIDLNDQSVNQRLAYRASVDNRLATIDLSAASDSIALGLVEWLLPPSWWAALDDSRSHYGWMPDGTLKKYSKISSMGNGFTFELESLIFWALTEATCDSLGIESKTCKRVEDGKSVSIYGDDIIIPVDATVLFQEVLAYCGFSLNENKSFLDGPFRESCGHHYFLGTDVRPIIVKDHISSDSRYLWFANNLKRWAAGFQPGVADPSIYPAYRRVVRKIENPLLRQVSIPDNIGDGGLIGDFRENESTRFDMKRWAYKARVLSEGSLQRDVFDEPALARWFMFAESTGCTQETAQRVALGMRKPKICVLRFLQWTPTAFWP